MYDQIAADTIRRQQDEIDRLQERCTEQAHWIDAAVSKCATQQCSRRAAQLLELQAEIERLRAELAAEKQDAERYRYLRGNYKYALELANSLLLFSAPELDAAIDAAMKDRK